VSERLDDGGVLRDRSFIEQMKADILRRAEEMSDSDEGDGDAGQRTLAFEEDDPAVNTVAIPRDGEESTSGSGSENEEGGTTKANPETILELAYIRDPTLFDRDAQTRRGKGWEQLKGATGWGDEQIDGWRIMLERNVSLLLSSLFLLNADCVCSQGRIGF
jgi:activating signal cointegrator complex subunit 2